MKTKKSNSPKLLIVVAAILGVVVILGIYSLKKYKEVGERWLPTFVNNETKAYDTYICYELLSDIFDKRIRSTRQPIYNNLKDSLDNYFYYDNEPYYDDYNQSEDDYGITVDTASVVVVANEPLAVDDEPLVVDNKPLVAYDAIEISDTTAYVFINKDFALDNVDLRYLLDFVGIGNNVFIAAESFSPALMDTLGLKTNSAYFSTDSIYQLVDYPAKKYSITNIYSNTTLGIEKPIYPLRVLATNNANDTIFVQLRYGKGNFYLHTVPNAFTNITLLDTAKYDFAFRSLSYLPRTNRVLWDEYQTQGPVDSIFRELLTQRVLLIALFITIIGFGLFMIFRAKRSQRVIPIIKPPVNSSIEFLETISNLYYQKKDFRIIAEKRHAYFLDYIRKHYYMSTEHIDDDFMKTLGVKSGVGTDTLNAIFDKYREITSLEGGVYNAVFIAYNNLLEDFYRTVKTNK